MHRAFNFWFTTLPGGVLRELIRGGDWPRLSESRRTRTLRMDKKEGERERETQREPKKSRVTDMKRNVERHTGIETSTKSHSSVFSQAGS